MGERRRGEKEEKDRMRDRNGGEGGGRKGMTKAS